MANNQLIEYTPPQIPQITSPETLQEATSILSQLNTKLDAITQDKELLTKPLNQSLKAIRDKYRPIETLLSQSIETIRSQMSQYATKVKQLEATKQATILAKVEAGKLKPDTAIKQLTKLESSSNVNTQSDFGKVTFKTVHLYRVTDMSKIPLEFLTIDDTLVKLAQKNNNPIAGIDRKSVV